MGADLHLGRVELARDGAEDEERELGGGVGEDVGRVREGDPVAVGGGAVDVVEPDRHLGHDLEAGGGPGGEHLLVDPVAQGRHEGVDPGAHLLEDELLRRRLDLGRPRGPTLARAGARAPPSPMSHVAKIRSARAVVGGRSVMLCRGGSAADNIAGVKPTDLRGILQYVPQFREKTFIIAVDGAIVTDENFANILMDVAVLWSLSIRTVLVHGASAQIKALAERAGIEPSDLEGSGVTDAPRSSSP